MSSFNKLVKCDRIKKNGMSILYKSVPILKFDMFMNTNHFTEFTYFFTIILHNRKKHEGK